MNRTYWEEEQISPIGFLAELRELVLARSSKRMPKWKIQVAPDLLVEIQPKLRGSLLFDCRADAAREGRREKGNDRLDFWILDRGADWGVKPRKGWRPKGASDDEVWSFRNRVMAALRTLEIDFDPRVMLQPNCLMCGKKLTDPASMARWFGPECFETTSLSVPRVLIAYDRQPEPVVAMPAAQLDLWSAP